MRRANPFRDPVVLVVITGGAVVAGILAYLFLRPLSSFDALVEYDPDAVPGQSTARSWGGPSVTADVPASGTDAPAPAGAASVPPVFTDAPRTAMPPAGSPVLNGLLETSLKNPVNRRVSMFVAEKTFDRLAARAVPGSSVGQDVAYVRALFDSVRSGLANGALDEAGVARAVRRGEALVRDRRLTPPEFDRMVKLLGEELGFAVDPGELHMVLERLRQPAHRDELKRLLQQEAGSIAETVAGNPVTRRIGVFMARRMFDRYRERICTKLPRGMTCAQAQALFENTMQSVVSERISSKDAGVLAGKMVDILIDRRITPREMEQLLVFIKQSVI